MMATQTDGQRAAEDAARHSYGRLVAFLAARSGDVAGAEDALSDAFAAALKTWPVSGPPANPEAWLLVAARRMLWRRHRHGKVTAAAEPEIIRAIEEAGDEAEEREAMTFPDERLNLLFVCAHPQIDVGAHTPLMLQTVLGVDAARIASAFCIAPATMGQRLVRAKNRIREAGIPFRLAEGDELVPRLAAVLEAVYAAYGLAWDEHDGIAPGGELGREAVYLARLLVEGLPQEPEAAALLALMLYSESRRAARRPGGEYAPLDRQDTALWDEKMIGEADALLVRAGRMNRFGKFQCEAAIQAVHCARLRTGVTDWPALAGLYEALCIMRPGLGAMVGRIAALSSGGRTGDALEAMAALETDPRTRAYQPWWAVRGHVLAAAGRRQEAAEALRTAAGMTEDAGLRRHLLAEAGRLA